MEYSSLLNQYMRDTSLLQKDVMSAVKVAGFIQGDMVRMASLYMKWAFLHSLCEQAVRSQKRTVEEDILPAARADAEIICKEQKRKALKQTLEDIAHADPGYLTAVKLLDQMQLCAAILKEAKIALLTKRDMLQSLNSRQKVELVALPEDTVDNWSEEGIIEDEVAEAPSSDLQEKQELSDEDAEALIQNYISMQEKN